VLISEASRVTDSMFLAAARALADYTCSHAPPQGSLYPNLCELREVSRLIAFKVAQTARDEGLGRSLDDASLQTSIDKFCWVPDYDHQKSQPGGTVAPPGALPLLGERVG
jgi:malate dehydrogenase (oxaloacetate-decarboxylating)